MDYATLHKLSYSLGRGVWRDLEINHPASKITRTVDDDGRISEMPAPRINALDHLVAVRAFYLDITERATEHRSTGSGSLERT